MDNHLNFVESIALTRRRSRIWRGGWPCWTATPACQSPAWRGDRTRCSGCGRSGSWRYRGPCSPRGCRDPRTGERWGWPRGTRCGVDTWSVLKTKYWDLPALDNDVSECLRLSDGMTDSRSSETVYRDRRRRPLGTITNYTRSSATFYEVSPGMWATGWLWGDISHSACNGEKSPW